MPRNTNSTTARPWSPRPRRPSVRSLWTRAGCGRHLLLAERPSLHAESVARPDGPMSGSGATTVTTTTLTPSDVVVVWAETSDAKEGLRVAVMRASVRAAPSRGAASARAPKRAPSDADAIRVLRT